MLTFIINPTAGSGYSVKVEEQLRNELAARRVPYEMLRTEGPGHATRLAGETAKRGTSDAVIAVGGDGTAFEVACGLLDTGVPLGIIPAGTGNDFIKTTGTPSKPMEALDFILSHQPRPVDIGALNDRMFLNVCGTGFDVTVLDNTLAAKKYCRGLLPYMIGLIRAIFQYHPVHVQLDVDGHSEEKDVLICSVDNGRYIGGGIPICPEAQPNDGLLDVVIVNNRPRWAIPFYLPGLMLGRVTHFKCSTHLKCKRVSLRSTGMRLNVDGEVFSMDSADFAVRPGKLLLYW